jgi:hypothetical protein
MLAGQQSGNGVGVLPAFLNLSLSWLWGRSGIERKSKYGSGLTFRDMASPRKDGSMSDREPEAVSLEDWRARKMWREIEKATLPDLIADEFGLRAGQSLQADLDKAGHLTSEERYAEFPPSYDIASPRRYELGGPIFSTPSTPLNRVSQGQERTQEELAEIRAQVHEAVIRERRRAWTMWAVVALAALIVALIFWRMNF